MQQDQFSETGVTPEYQNSSQTDNYIIEDKPSGSRGGKMVAIVVGILITIALVGGVAYAYMAGHLQFLMGEPFKSETLLSDTVLALSEVESGRFLFDLGIESVEREPGTVPFPVELFDEASYSDLQSLVSDMSLVPSDFFFSLGLSSTFDLSGTKNNGSEGQLTMDLELDDFSVNSDLEFVTDGLEQFFFRINRFPSFFFDLGNLKGEWFGVTKYDLQALGIDVDFLNSSSLTEDSDQDELAEFVKFMHEFIEILETNKIYTGAGEPITEKIAGENLYKYKLQINGENMLEFFDDSRELYEKYRDSLDLGEFPYTDEDIEFFTNQKIIDYYNTQAPWFVWVTARGEVRQFGLQAKLLVNEAGKDIPRDHQLNVTMTFRFEDVNEPVVVSLPEDALTLEELAEKVPVVDEALESIRETQRRQIQTPVDRVLSYADSYSAENGRYPASLEQLYAFVEDKNPYSQVRNSDADLLYTSVSNGLGFVVCNEYQQSGNYYCGTDSAVGDVPLDQIGDPLDSLADMYGAINNAIMTGEYFTPEKRDEMREQYLLDVRSDFSRHSFNYSSYDIAWNSFDYSSIPQYVEIEFRAFVNEYDRDDFELCSQLEASPKKWCVSDTSFGGYEK